MSAIKGNFKRVCVALPLGLGSAAHAAFAVSSNGTGGLDRWFGWLFRFWA